MLTLFSALPREPESPSFHWHIELRPLTRPVDVHDLALDAPVCVVPPEEAAAELRRR
jgi:galactose-1-phosphate uridylyltransferase